MQVRKAPKFESMHGSNADVDARAVELLFRAVDGQFYAVAIDAGVVGPTMVALAGHSAELSASLPDNAAQALAVQDMSLSMAESGEMSLTLHLPSNLKMHLSVSRDQLGKLDALLSDLRDMVGRNVQ